MDEGVVSTVRLHTADITRKAIKEKNGYPRDSVGLLPLLTGSRRRAKENWCARAFPPAPSRPLLMATDKIEDEID